MQTGQVAMAARSLFLHLRRNASADMAGRSGPFSLLPLSASASAISNLIFARFLSSAAAADEPPCSIESDDLRSRIFRLRLPKKSATTVIEKWIGEGNSVSISDLRGICRELRRLHRYKHALEMSEWMTNHDEFKLSDSDYATRIVLMTKVFGIDAAERYFHCLPKSEKTKETHTALLHSYASAKLTDKAEELFERIINDSQLSLTAITYNEMMTLYMSVDQVEKVSSVVEEMKCRKVSLDLFTYNLWISSLASNLDINGIQNVLEEMGSDSNCNEDWRRYRSLTNIYVTSGQLSKVGSSGVLVEAQKGVTLRECITYDLLIILYAGLGNKDMIDQIWKSLRMTNMKMTSRSYMCVLSAYVMLDSMKEVREIMNQWKQSTPTGGFDESSYDRLTNAFAEAGLSEKAETLCTILDEKS